MKRILVMSLTALMAASAAVAKEYQSSFGLRFSAPDNWLVVTKPELASNPALAAGQSGSIDPELRAKIESGSVEFLYDRTTSDATFSDNVNLRVGRGTVPGNEDAVKAECARYGQALAKVAGRPLAVARCEVRDLGTSKTLYVEYEGRTAGTVTIQYQLVRPDGKLVFVTATCKRATLDKFRPEFEAIVQSIRFS